MGIKILSENEIKQQSNHSFSVAPLLFSVPQNSYARRIERLKTLAENHPFADYLQLVQQIVEAQQQVLLQSPITKLEHIEMPQYALHIETWQRNTIWQKLLQQLLQQLEHKANTQVLASIQALQQYSEEQLEQFADDLLAQRFEQIDTDKAIFVWAALSLYWTQLAQQLPRTAHKESAEGLHICPVCHAPPVASLVHFGTEQGLRYLHCSLCETQWNVVRAKCSNCDQSGKIDYWSLDNQFAPVKAESCGDCESYLKVMYQEKDPKIDVIADDLASLFLDREMEEKGFYRSGLNPFLFPQAVE